MSLTIRAGTSADIPVLQELERDAAQAFRSSGYDFCAVGPVRDFGEHERCLNEGASFVAEIESDPAGFILVWPVDGHAHLTEVSVALQFQRRGIGRMLIAAGEQWSRETGYKEVTLTTYRDVSWNAPFYPSLGYRQFTPGPDQKGLLAVQAEETASGFNAKPRVAMRKAL